MATEEITIEVQESPPRTVVEINPFRNIVNVEAQPSEVGVIESPIPDSFEITLPKREDIPKHYFSNATIIRGETPLGLIDGSNQSFTVANNITTPFIWIYLNGLVLVPADYTVVLPRTITLHDAPFPGDTIIVDYLL